MKILLLEDDAILSDLIYHSLLENDYEVKHAEDGNEALQYVENEKFDLFIFDINVPGPTGLELLKNLREYNITTPTIMITAYQDTRYLRDGFDFGCDDYIKKPFDLEELNHRVKNLIKRFVLNDDDILILDENNKLNTNKNILYVKDKEFEITHKETSILSYLAARKGRAINFDELIQNIWNYEDVPSETTIRVYIKNLRDILGKDKIKTIRGLGYSYE